MPASWAGNSGGSSNDIYLKRYDNAGAVVNADVRVSDRSLVWNSDLIETFELANLLDQALVTATLLAVYPFLQSALAMGTCSILLGFSLGVVQPMIMSTLHFITPPHRQGEALGLRLMSINVSSILMPMVFGTVGTAIGVASVFCGYETATQDEAKITAIFVDGKSVETAPAGEKAEIVLDTTPFYGESGGQTGDTGYLEGDGFRFHVEDTKKPVENFIVHQGVILSGEIKVGAAARLIIDLERRRAIAANHSGTHLLQAALKAVLGDHIKQSGSLVNAERLRFDFTHFSRISEEELRRVETIVNDMIRRNVSVQTDVCALEEALKTDLDPCLDCYMLLKFLRVTSIQNHIVFIIIFFYQNINISLAYILNIFCDLINRISIDLPVFPGDG